MRSHGVITLTGTHTNHWKDALESVPFAPTLHRVAISSYLVYVAQSDLIQFVAQLHQEDDPYAYISRGGREATAVAAP